MNLLEVNHISKVYTSGNNEIQALKDINFSVDKGEFVAIMGESGSGKSTLLNILAALDRPTGGEVHISGHNLQNISDDELSNFRRENLGFIFQEFNLLDTFNIKDNILLPLVLSGWNSSDMENRLSFLIERLGIKKLIDKNPYELSGGQKQRVAVARALINQPQLILADEPTGALDSHTSDNLLKLFSEINQEGQTIMMVTHSTKAASQAKRVLFIRDGYIFHELNKGESSNEEMYEKISKTLTFLASGADKNVQ